MITGVNHVTLSVLHIDRSFVFYNEILGMRPVAKWPKGAYLQAGDLWIALAVDPHVRSGPLAEYSHVAFSVSTQDFGRMSRHIRSSGAMIWQDNWTEGESLYFTDPDGHKLEIHASSLEARIRSARQEPWEGLELFDGESSELG